MSAPGTSQRWLRDRLDLICTSLTEECILGRRQASTTSSGCKLRCSDGRIATVSAPSQRKSVSVLVFIRSLTLTQVYSPDVQSKPLTQTYRLHALYVLVFVSMYVYLLGAVDTTLHLNPPQSLSPRSFPPCFPYRLASDTSLARAPMPRDFCPERCPSSKPPVLDGHSSSSGRARVRDTPPGSD
ncbi:hypothetical protein K439DRAFT_682730 [Ramaria rubella]|nr:hypothetical protein K439DRAFT_682730 [Ramaria rubella]